MANILDGLLNSPMAQNVVNELSGSNQANKSDITNIISTLAPILLSKTKENVGNSSSMLDLFNNSNENIDAKDKNFGNQILGQVLGSKDNSRELASKLSEQTGVSSMIIKQALPMVANMIFSQIAKNFGGAKMQNASSLLSFLDQDKDGQIVDDILGFVGKKLF